MKTIEPIDVDFEERCLRKVEPKIQYFLKKAFYNSEEGEDVKQMARVKFLDTLRKKDYKISNLEAYVNTILKSVLSDYLRKIKVRRLRECTFLDTYGSRAEEVPDAENEGMIIEKVFCGSKIQEVLSAIEEEGHKKWLDPETKGNRKTVRTRKFRLRQFLKEKITVE